MNILLFSGSLRKDSLNKKLIAVVDAKLKERTNINVSTIDLQSYRLPVYDGDIEEVGIPGEVTVLGDIIKKSDALIVSTPEYNGSISSPLKNVIDWVSRLDTDPWKNKPLLLLSASPGALGGVRGLWHTRVPFEALGVHVYPQMFGLPKADIQLTTPAKLADERLSSNLSKLLDSFLTHLIK